MVTRPVKWAEVAAVVVSAAGVAAGMAVDTEAATAAAAAEVGLVAAAEVASEGETAAGVASAAVAVPAALAAAGDSLLANSPGFDALVLPVERPE